MTYKYVLYNREYYEFLYELEMYTSVIIWVPSFQTECEPTYLPRVYVCLLRGRCVFEFESSIMQQEINLQKPPVCISLVVESTHTENSNITIAWDLLFNGKLLLGLTVENE